MAKARRRKKQDRFNSNHFLFLINYLLVSQGNNNNRGRRAREKEAHTGTRASGQQDGYKVASMANLELPKGGVEHLRERVSCHIRACVMGCIV
jgi:hypothetical protein